MVTDSVRSLATRSAVVGALALAALVLVMLLAFAARDQLPGGVVLRGLALAAAVLGAILIVTGSVLVLTGRTGRYLAGPWSALGWGILGVWFLVLAVTLFGSTSWPMWLRGLGGRGSPRAPNAGLPRIPAAPGLVLRRRPFQRVTGAGDSASRPRPSGQPAHGTVSSVTLRASGPRELARRRRRAT
jgi:hypothetical protein